MVYRHNAMVAMVLLCSAGLVAGCDSGKQPGSQERPAQAQTMSPASTPATATAAAGDDEKEIAKALAELSPEERTAAEKQRVCPVSGERLGSMGKPYKVTVKGHSLFLCCSGCEDELKQNPDKYLAKLKK